MKNLFIVSIGFFLLTACELKDLQKKDKEDANTCSKNEYGYCTSIVEGQVYYSIREILTSKYGSYSLDYFKIFLVGEGHAYPIDVDEAGNYSSGSIEPGKYTLIAEYFDPIHHKIIDDVNGISLIGDFRDNNSNPYLIGYVKKVTVTEQKVNSINLINPQRLYVDNNTGDIIAITANMDSEELEEYVGEQIADY